MYHLSHTISMICALMNKNQVFAELIIFLNGSEWWLSNLTMHQNQLSLLKSMYFFAVIPRLTKLAYPWVCQDMGLHFIILDWAHSLSCFSKLLGYYPCRYVWPRNHWDWSQVWSPGPKCLFYSDSPEGIRRSCWDFVTILGVGMDLKEKGAASS